MTDPAAPGTQRDALAKLVLESHQAEYRELSENWRLLDTKAQGATAIGGVFLAAAFAFARDGASQLVVCQKALLTIAIVCLVGSVVLAVLALRVRGSALPPIGEQFEDLVNDILRAPTEEHAARLQGMTRDQARLWKEASVEAASHNENKANLLRWSVSVLLIAIVAVAALAIWEIAI